MNKIRALTFSSLYPNAAQPGHGIFTEHRLRNLLATNMVETRVVAPVPWVPSVLREHGRYRDYVRVPAADRRAGIDILYPRYPLLPKIGMSVAPFLMAAALLAPLRRMPRGGFDFDVVDAFYFYPDGVAAVILGQILKKPVVVTAYGTDLNLIPNFAVPRLLIRWAARHAAAITTVCQSLKDVLVDLNVPGQRVHVILHGVDSQLFAPPADRAALRARLGLAHPALLSVGNLIELKGHHIAIAAMPDLRDMDLLIAGSGEWEQKLRGQAAGLALGDRVRFLGQLDQVTLRDYYGAADALILASSREGIANVLLESMACGTPVIATPVSGLPEVITMPEAGVLMADRTPRALATAVRALLRAYPDRRATRRYAERYKWRDTAVQHLAVLERAVDRHRAAERDWDTAA